jgi:hypothetical protein
VVAEFIQARCHPEGSLAARKHTRERNHVSLAAVKCRTSGLSRRYLVTVPSGVTVRQLADIGSPDHSHFTIAIPDDWTDQDLLELIFLPPRDPGKRNWPAWEIPAYDFVSFRLFRFWKGEKKPER